MRGDTLGELSEPMLNSAGADPLALYIHPRTPASDDSLPCLKNPRPEGAESSLTESASSPFQAEPAQFQVGNHQMFGRVHNRTVNQVRHAGLNAIIEVPHGFVVSVLESLFAEVLSDIGSPTRDGSREG